MKCKEKKLHEKCGKLITIVYIVRFTPKTTAMTVTTARRVEFWWWWCASSQTSAIACPLHVCVINVFIFRIMFHSMGFWLCQCFIFDSYSMCLFSVPLMVTVSLSPFINIRFLLFVHTLTGKWFIRWLFCSICEHKMQRQNHFALNAKANRKRQSSKRKMSTRNDCYKFHFLDIKYCCIYF